MILRIGIRAFVKMIICDLLIWIFISLSIYFFSGSFKAALPIGILIIVFNLIFFHNTFKKFYKYEIDKQ